MKRQIQLLIENHIDKKIANQLIVPAKDTNPNTLHVMALKALVGIAEHGGNNSGTLVESIQMTIGRAAREPWCMSAQQTAVAYVEKKTGLRCTLPVSEHCMTTLREAKKLGIVVDNPIVGDLMIWQHGDSDRGHVAGIIEDGDEFVRTAEGNTGPDQKVNREGDGFYTKLRSLKGSGDMKVVGFIRLEFVLRE